MRKALWIKKKSSGEEIRKVKVTCAAGSRGWIHLSGQVSWTHSVHASKAPCVCTRECVGVQNFIRSGNRQVGVCVGVSVCKDTEPSLVGTKVPES